MLERRGSFAVRSYPRAARSTSRRPTRNGSACSRARASASRSPSTLSTITGLRPSTAKPVSTHVAETLAHALMPSQRMHVQASRWLIALWVLVRDWPRVADPRAAEYKVPIAKLPRMAREGRAALEIQRHARGWIVRRDLHGGRGRRDRYGEAPLCHRGALAISAAPAVASSEHDWLVRRALWSNSSSHPSARPTLGALLPEASRRHRTERALTTGLAEQIAAAGLTSSLPLAGVATSTEHRDLHVPHSPGGAEWSSVQADQNSTASEIAGGADRVDRKPVQEPKLGCNARDTAEDKGQRRHQEAELDVSQVRTSSEILSHL